MIPLTNHDSQWGRSEVVIIYPYTYIYIYIIYIYILINYVYIYNANRMVYNKLYNLITMD